MGNTPTLNTYVSDMLALTRHVNAPIQNQREDKAVRASSSAARIVDECASVLERQISALDECLTSLGGHSASGLKEGVASIFGAAAAVIDNARKTEVSKDLRDDYTALCLMSAAYTMLHTTALGLKDQKVAKLAENNLSEVAGLVMKVNAILPVVVLKELQDEGVVVDSSVAQEAEKNSENAWSKGAQYAGAGS